MKQISYRALGEALNNLELGLSAAEFHGRMCAVLIAVSSQEVEDWLYALVGLRDRNDIIAKQAVERLSATMTHTLGELNDPQFKFNLLLPDIEQNIKFRLKAFAAWCDGFLYGLGLFGVNLAENEFINDLVEISRVETELDSDEQNERNLLELIEFVRMGVLNLQEDLRPVSSDCEIYSETRRI